MPVGVGLSFSHQKYTKNLCHKVEHMILFRDAAKIKNKQTNKQTNSTHYNYCSLNAFSAILLLKMRIKALLMMQDIQSDSFKNQVMILVSIHF